MTELALFDILHDRAKLLRLLQVAYWMSLVLITIGFIIILMDFLD